MGDVNVCAGHAAQPVERARVKGLAVEMRACEPPGK